MRSGDVLRVIAFAGVVAWRLLRPHAVPLWSDWPLLVSLYGVLCACTTRARWRAWATVALAAYLLVAYAWESGQLGRCATIIRQLIA